MVDLFRVTAPVMIRHPDGTQRVMVELFRHPRGLLYFEPFWDSLPGAQGIHLVEGDIRGEGPWKAGECVITVLGCQGTHPELAAGYAAWRACLGAQGVDSPSQQRIDTLAREHGAQLPEPGKLSD